MPFHERGPLVRFTSLFTNGVRCPFSTQYQRGATAKWAQNGKVSKSSSLYENAKLSRSFQHCSFKDGLLRRSLSASFLGPRLGPKCLIFENSKTSPTILFQHQSFGCHAAEGEGRGTIDNSSCGSHKVLRRSCDTAIISSSLSVISRRRGRTLGLRAHETT